jgi:hypothetical protein
MRGIYQGERVSNIGSFVLFLQSPAGMMCMILIIVGIFGIPVMERKIEKEELKRLAILLALQEKKDEEELLKKAEPKVEETEPQKEYYFVRCGHCCPYTCPYACPYKQGFSEQSDCSQMQ